MDTDSYTYRVAWSADDGEHVGLCREFPSMIWLAQTPGEALAGIRRLVDEVVIDMRTSGERAPAPRVDRGGDPAGLTAIHHLT